MLDAFGQLLAEEYGRTIRRQEALSAVFADLNRLRRKPIGETHPADELVTVLGSRDEVLGASGALHRAATRELLDVRSLADEPKPRALVHRVLHEQALPCLRVADRRTALIAESPESGLLVRSASFATGMGEMFDLLWDKAVRTSSHLPPARRQVLRLMASGMDDAAVAAATGRSIRTVRAHIAAIMVALGAETRLAAGAEAARRGWLP